MKIRSLWTAAGIAAALVIGTAGCGGGGGGGGSSHGGGGGGTGGGALSASMTLLGGLLESTAAAGSTTNVQLADRNQQLHTINSVYSPDVLNSQSYAYCTVIRAGSNLMSGHYTSTSAKYINATENFSATIPLTASGTFAKDTIIPGNGTIVLPIGTIGAYSFPNGITVTLDSGANDFAVQNNTLRFSVNILSSRQIKGQLIFTDTGTVSPQATMSLNFSSQDGQSGLQLDPPSPTNSLSPVSLAGVALGSVTVLPNTYLFYDLEE